MSKSNDASGGSPQDLKRERLPLLGLAFLEGGAVMACELLGARLVAPFFGNSLYVWAAVLGVTLTALMSGYYLGGYLSEKFRGPKLVFLILIAAGLLLMVMPYTSQWVMKATLGMSVKWGATLSLSLFMFAPLMGMGMSSPVIIDMLNRSVDTSGKTAGSVYAISTSGGILSTFLMGFYLMPEFGLRGPAFLFGALLAGASALALLRRGDRQRGIAALVLAGLGALPLTSAQKREAGGIRIVAIEEGVMGQIKVLDRQLDFGEAGSREVRSLYVNNILQSHSDLLHQEDSVLDHVFAFSAATSVFPEGSEALLLGLGGGDLWKRFKQFGFEVDTVEIDERVRDVAVEYFGVDPAEEIIIDDARHFLNTTEKTYDLIATDVFLNETPPQHVLTLESFVRMKEALRPEGVIFLNFLGQLTGEEGRATRSLVKTIQAAGLVVNLWFTPGPEDHRNLLVFAGHRDPDFSAADYREAWLPNLHLGNLELLFYDMGLLDMEDALVLHDSHPALEKIYLGQALAWRQSSREFVRDSFVGNDLMLSR